MKAYTNLIKFILLISVIYLLIRIRNNKNTIEGFTDLIDMDELNQPLSNQIMISRIKRNEDDNSYEIMLDKKYSLHYVHLKTNVTNTGLKYVVYFKDDEGNYNENFIYQNNEIEHSNRVHNENGIGNLVISNPRKSQLRRPYTSAIKIKLLDGQSFIIKKTYLFGTTNGVLISPELLKQKITSQVPILSNERTTDPSTGNVLYKLLMKSPKTNIYGLSFNYSINNSKSIGNHNAIFKVEIYYDQEVSGKTSIYKLNSMINTSDYKEVDGIYSTNIYLEQPIDSKKLYLTIPKSVVINGNDNSIGHLSNFKLLVGNQTSNFQNVETSSNNSMSNTQNNNNQNRKNNQNRNREDFQSVEYSADELCPSLGGIEHQMKLADTICERIEYNDKIKNERLKLERNKQYIMKLKAQDEEIEKLEKLIKSLQEKRDSRDAYNDALRLAQLQEQKKKASLVKKLVDKRVKHKNRNQVQLELNLVDEPTF